MKKLFEYILFFSFLFTKTLLPMDLNQSFNYSELSDLELSDLGLSDLEHGASLLYSSDYISASKFSEDEIRTKELLEKIKEEDNHRGDKRDSRLIGTFLCILYEHWLGAKINKNSKIKAKHFIEYLDKNDIHLNYGRINGLLYRFKNLSEEDRCDKRTLANISFAKKKLFRNDLLFIERLKVEEINRGNRRCSTLEIALLSILYEKWANVRINKKIKFKLISFKKYLLKNGISINYEIINASLHKFKHLSEEKQTIRKKLAEDSLIDLKLTKKHIDTIEDKKKFIIKKLKKENSMRRNERRSGLERALFCILYEYEFDIKINENTKFDLSGFQEYLESNSINIKPISISSTLYKFKKLSEEKKAIRRKLAENSLVKKELTPADIELISKKKMNLLTKIKREDSNNKDRRVLGLKGALICILYEQCYGARINENSKFNLSDFQKYLLENSISISYVRISNFLRYFKHLSEKDRSDKRKLVNASLIERKPSQEILSIIEKIKEEKINREGTIRSKLSISFLCSLYEKWSGIRINKNSRFELKNFSDYLIENGISINYINLGSILHNFKNMSEENKAIRRQLVEDSLIEPELSNVSIDGIENCTTKSLALKNISGNTSLSSLPEKDNIKDIIDLYLADQKVNIINKKSKKNESVYMHTISILKILLEKQKNKDDKLIDKNLESLIHGLIVKIYKMQNGKIKRKITLKNLEYFYKKLSESGISISLDKLKTVLNSFIMYSDLNKKLILEKVDFLVNEFI